MRLLPVILFLIGLSTGLCEAQQYEVNCTDRPLNELLIQMGKQYDLQFSFNDQLLSQYHITAHRHFSSKEEMMAFLLDDLPLGYEKSGEIFIIYPVRQEPVPVTYHLSGMIMETGTQEVLPFSHVLVNDFGMITDLKGSFSYSSTTDSVFHVKASHLGCYVLDTVLQAGRNQMLFLTPAPIGIPEIVVQNNIVEKSAQLGEAPGLTKLNPYIANYLPGNGDNSVFNLLRLQPGVLAAGEQPNDLIIWGSPEGTSRVTFDGFTIWGLKNFNDNISAVNPYLAKNVHVSKGGYEVMHEDVVGGIVDITGINGSTEQAGYNLFVNNQTVNGMVEMPLFKKSSLVVAFRQSYTDLIEADDLKVNQSQGSAQGGGQININPDYQFRDFNLKYSINGKNGDLFYISMLGAKDDFSYAFERPFNNRSVLQSSEEVNTQTGATLYYGKNWKNGARSHMKLSHSGFNSTYAIHRDVEVRWNGRVTSRIDEHADTDVDEWSLELKHEWQLAARHLMNGGAGIVHNGIQLVEDTFNIVVIDLHEQVNRLYLFAQDQWSLGTDVKLTGGLRFNKPGNIDKGFIDPRLSMTIRSLGYLKFNLAWGRYHQFLVKSSLLDESGNYRYTWSIADDETVPVMSSTHYVAGAVWSKNNLTASVDGYYKDVDGLTRYIRLRSNDRLYEGLGRSYGVDFYVKKDFGYHSIWSSYSLGKTEELFPYFRPDEYRRSPQDQRHEWKVAGLLNFKNWHISANYVYGSGFPLYTDIAQKDYTEPDYNRVDASVVYKRNHRHFHWEIGLSVLNLLDADNVKYSSFTRVPVDQLNTIYINTESVGFTPLLYMKIGF